ncbi:MAG: patatin-like phospholipase family protein [Geminicoccaceae bacterium]
MSSNKNSKARPKRGAKPRRINLGLQGGGAHGAFTWGVLDRLLEDGRLEIEGIVGTSAGAMNAVVAAAGLQQAGREGARERLRAFWQATSEAARRGPIQPSPLDRWLSTGNLDYSPSWHFFDGLSRVLSPYQANPLNINPLRDVLNDVVDFDAVRASKRIKLFLCATNVRTGRIKVFMNDEIGIDAVLASACLPFMYQAVEIDGEHYWDGGYMGNPPIFPLIYNTDCPDVLIIQINPINIPAVPRTAQEIFDRINTLSFNSSLMREMRAIGFVTKLIDEGRLDPDGYKRLNVHTIDAEVDMARLSVSSKLNADASFLATLFDLGRERASHWLDAHFDDVGIRSSTDIEAKFF